MSRFLGQVMACVAVILSLALTAPLRGDDPAKPKDEGAKTSKVGFVLLEGTPYNRGLTHGKTLKAETAEAVRLWKADLKRQLKKDPDEFIKDFVAKTDFVPAIKKWTPDLLEEIKGLAEGSGIDYDTMFAYQFVDEVWVYAEAISGDRCSAIGFARSRKEPTQIAQNMDLECFRDGAQVVLHIKEKDSDLECLVLTCAGMIGLNGVNNKRIGVCCNTLGQLANCRDGLPVNCVIRGLLQRTTEEEAIKFLKEVKHASGQNYLLGGPDHVHDFECSANKVCLYQPPDRDGVWHTNHPLVNDDYNARYKKQKPNPADNSHVRFDALEQRLRKASTDSHLDLIRTTLASRDSTVHPICRVKPNASNTGEGVFTWAASIMVLADQAELLVCAGPPDGKEYQRFSFANKPR